MLRFRLRHHLILRLTGIMAGAALVYALLPAGYSVGTGESVYALKGISGHLQDENGSPIDNVDVSIFDGFTIHSAKSDTGGIYEISEIPVSIDRYAVIFFTKEGYIPKTVNLKVQEEKAIRYSAVMKKSHNSDSGFVTGTIYQPVRGGKIRFQSGIYGFKKGRQVLLAGDADILKRTTDTDGHFLFEVQAGTYKLSGEGVRKTAEVHVSPGRTVIKNLRSGLVLID